MAIRARLVPVMREAISDEAISDEGGNQWQSEHDSYLRTQTQSNAIIRDQTQSECSRGADPSCHAIEGELHGRLYGAIGRHPPCLEPLGTPQRPMEIADLE